MALELRIPPPRDPGQYMQFRQCANERLGVARESDSAQVARGFVLLICCRRSINAIVIATGHITNTMPDNAARRTTVGSSTATAMSTHSRSSPA